MKITKCLLSKHYSLGSTECTGCVLSSVTPCETEFPATDDYGVVSTEPAAVTAIPGLFGLPSSTTVATAWCSASAGSTADISFPGYLWTRDASGTLSRASSAEATNVPAICTQ